MKRVRTKHDGRGRAKWIDCNFNLELEMAECVDGLHGMAGWEEGRGKDDAPGSGFNNWVSGDVIYWECKEEENWEEAMTILKCLWASTQICQVDSWTCGSWVHIKHMGWRFMWEGWGYTSSPRDRERGPKMSHMALKYLQLGRTGGASNGRKQRPDLKTMWIVIIWKRECLPEGESHHLPQS